jgi:hypothetical protein
MKVDETTIECPHEIGKNDLSINGLRLTISSMQIVDSINKEMGTRWLANKNIDI